MFEILYPSVWLNSTLPLNSKRRLYWEVGPGVWGVYKCCLRFFFFSFLFFSFLFSSVIVTTMVMVLRGYEYGRPRSSVMMMMSYGYSYDYEDFVRVHRLDGFNWKGWMGGSLDLARSFYFDLSLFGKNPFT